MATSDEPPRRREAREPGADDRDVDRARLEPPRLGSPCRKCRGCAGRSRPADQPAPGDATPGVQIGYSLGSSWTVIHRSSVNSSTAAAPPKRPQPLALTPPNGICGSSCTVVSFTWHIPVSSRRATSRAAGTLELNTADDSPYSVSLATRTASSTPSTETIETTGPNDSSE